MGNLGKALESLGRAALKHGLNYTAVGDAFSAYHGEQEKPRMMQANNNGKCAKRSLHDRPHRWTPHCDLAPQCEPAQQENLRMMQEAGPDRGDNPFFHKGVHPWTPACAVYPECTPAAPAPKHKLEAGCIVRANEMVPTGRVRDGCGEWKEQRGEVVSVGKHEILTTFGYCKMGDCEATAPATPEVGDYVRIDKAYGQGCSFGGVVIGIDPDERRDLTIYAPGGPLGSLRHPEDTGLVFREHITIIAKARHAREMAEGRE